MTESRLKMTVTLRNASATIAVFLWSSELTFVGLNLTELQSLWAACDSKAGRQARLGLVAVLLIREPRLACARGLVGESESAGREAASLASTSASLAQRDRMARALYRGQGTCRLLFLGSG